MIELHVQCNLYQVYNNKCMYFYMLPFSMYQISSLKITQYTVYYLSVLCCNYVSNIYKTSFYEEHCYIYLLYYMA
jgi:hypothetical protein